MAPTVRAEELIRRRIPLPLKVRVARLGRRVLRWEGERFDRSLGIETAGGVSSADPTVVEGDAGEGIALGYVGQPPRVMRWWLRSLPSRLDQFTFIDMGSAKGRVLFAAAAQGFRRTVGIEYIKELHEQAVANVSRCRRREARTVVPLLGDAASFEFPLDPLVVHFANPFSEKVMERVITNLTVSYERRPRPVFATYLQAWRERPENTTRNVELLAAATPFARHRLLPKDRLLESLLLRPHRVDLFESPEAVEYRRQTAPASAAMVPLRRRQLEALKRGSKPDAPA
jgi:hypothetical protein